MFPKLFLARGLVWNSWATYRWDHQFWYQTQYLFSLLWAPFTFWLGIKRLPIRLKLLMVPPYFALDIFLRFNSRVTSATFLDVIDQIVNLVEVCPFEATPFTFWLGIERLPIRLKILVVPPYFALDIFLRFNSRVTSATFLDVIDQIVNLVEVCPFEATPYPFRKYDEDPQGRTTTSSWWPEAENWRHQCNGSTSSRRATKDEKIR